MKPNRIISVLLLASLLLTGCVSNFIHEDAQNDDLPQIDPTASQEYGQDLRLYYRIYGQHQLAAINRYIDIHPSESVAIAVINALLSSPGSLESGLISAIPPDTRVLSSSRDGDLMTVTLSKEFMDYSVENLSYDELQSLKRLAVYSIVNTFCSIPGVMRVQLLVDTTGNGAGMRVVPFLIGFSSEEISSAWLEPLRFNESYVASPENMCSIILEMFQNQQPAEIYSFLANYDENGYQKPGYEVFTREIYNVTKILDYTVHPLTGNSPSSVVELSADISFVNVSGETINATDVKLVMCEENNVLFKLSYSSLSEALNTGNNN